MRLTKHSKHNALNLQHIQNTLRKPVPKCVLATEYERDFISHQLKERIENLNHRKINNCTPAYRKTTAKEKVVKNNKPNKKFPRDCSIHTKVNINVATMPPLSQAQGCCTNNSASTTKENSSCNTRSNSLQFNKKEIAHLRTSHTNQSPVNSVESKEPNSSKKKNICSQISPLMRILIVDWLSEVRSELKLSHNALFNAIFYLDKYVSKNKVSRSQYQLIATCSLFLATKLQHAQHPDLSIFLLAADQSFSKEELLSKESKMLTSLNYRLNPPTLYQYMLIFLCLIKGYRETWQKGGSDPGLPEIEWNGEIVRRCMWMMEGVIIKGTLQIKASSKENICFSIIYITIIDQYDQKSKVGYRKGIRARVAANAARKKQRERHVQAKTQQINEAYERFMSYVCQRDKKLEQLFLCLQALESLRAVRCGCESNDEFAYHKELKLIALGDYQKGRTY